MKRVALVRVAAVVLSVACIITAADAWAQGDLASIPKNLQCLVDQKKIPGAVTLVAREGKLIHSTVVGYQDIATRVPMRKDTIFRLYSMSKPITSVMEQARWRSMANL